MTGEDVNCYINSSVYRGPSQTCISTVLSWEAIMPIVLLNSISIE